MSAPGATRCRGERGSPAAHRSRSTRSNETTGSAASSTTISRSRKVAELLAPTVRSVIAGLVRAMHGDPDQVRAVAPLTEHPVSVTAGCAHTCYHAPSPLRGRKCLAGIEQSDQRVQRPGAGCCELDRHHPTRRSDPPAASPQRRDQRIPANRLSCTNTKSHGLHDSFGTVQAKQFSHSPFHAELSIRARSEVLLFRCRPKMTSDLAELRGWHVRLLGWTPPSQHVYGTLTLIYQCPWLRPGTTCRRSR